MPAAVQSEAAQPLLDAEYLFAIAQDALVAIDIDSDRILRWNPAAERLFGYSSAEVVGKNVQVLMPPDVAHLHRERMAQYRRTGDAEALAGRARSSVTALHSSGAELRVEVSIVPLPSPDAPSRWALLTFRDARCEPQPERAVMAEARADVARDQLLRRLRECEHLLRETTHDIARPLARARRSTARLVRQSRHREATEPERLTRLAQVVDARTREVEHTLRQIATAATIQSGTFEMRAQRVNLVPLLGRVVARVRMEIPSHRLNFAGPQGLTAVCDPERIEAVVADLIERAVRRNPRGCWIDVDLTRPLVGVARIEVRDYGRRLSPRERVRLEATGRSADRGWLINRHIVEQHGGTLNLDYPAESGVRVSFSLPTHRGKVLSA